MKGNSKGGKVNTEQFYELKEDVSSVQKSVSSLEKEVYALKTTVTVEVCNLTGKYTNLEANYKVLDGSVKGLEKEISLLKENTTKEMGLLRENTTIQIGSLKDSVNSLKWYIGVPLAFISLLGIIGTSIAIYKNLSTNKESGLVGNAHAQEQRIKDDSAERYIKSVFDKYMEEKNTKDVHLNYRLVFPGDKK